MREAEDGLRLEPDHLYLIPPDADMALKDGCLALSPRPGRRAPHMPIDHLFRSLADHLKSRAVGVILSGGGTDGALGFQAIKAEGGITFAQDEKSARYESMPRAAVADGSVDHVLRPAEIAATWGGSPPTPTPPGPRRRPLGRRTRRWAAPWARSST